ncbi:hypothetical protein F5883DRAFT_622700 [Diaporthe sp. PMI_573]|nr:hypothetical protein F5883DRAFT_622700 [Diaporthaceae sp. PMI_573]
MAKRDTNVVLAVGRSAANSDTSQLHVTDDNAGRPKSRAGMAEGQRRGYGVRCLFGAVATNAAPGSYTAACALELPEGTCNDDADDSGSECSITSDDVLTEGGDQPSRPKRFECPDKTCDHKAFGRNQDLIRHFMKHCEINRRCDGYSHDKKVSFANHDGCCEKFHFAAKYVSHKCPSDLDHKKAAKERFDDVHGDVKSAPN